MFTCNTHNTEENINQGSGRGPALARSQRRERQLLPRLASRQESRKYSAQETRGLLCNRTQNLSLVEARPELSGGGGILTPRSIRRGGHSARRWTRRGKGD